MADFLKICYTTYMNDIGFFQGTFDILNAGHVRAFRLAKEQCERLVVGLNSDRIVELERNREAIIPYVQRKEILEGIKYIDYITKADTIYALPFLRKFNADLYILTEEWAERQKDALAYIESIGGRHIFMERFPDIYCSSDIRARVRDLT